MRAAALAEAAFGAGVGHSPFLFAIVGTGASVCLVVDGRPYTGSRGQAITLGAPPVERVASGRALALAAGAERAEDVIADPAHAALVDAAAAELGQVLAVLANALDPAVIVLGGGLGTEPAFRERVEAACRPLLEYPSTPAPRRGRLRAGPGRWHRRRRHARRGRWIGLRPCWTRPACGAT